MSITAWPLSKKTIKKALDFWHTNPEPSGTEEFHYICDGQDCYLFCPNPPDFIIKRFVPLDELRYYDDNTLLSAIHSINERNHQVKVSFTGEERVELLFQLCSRERLYLNFLKEIVSLTRKLDDVITSFRMACQMVSEEEIELVRREVEHMWDSGDNPFVKALRNY